MFLQGKIELIDKNDLIDVLMKSDCIDKQKLAEIIDGQPVLAVARHKYEIEVYA